MTRQDRRWDPRAMGGAMRQPFTPGTFHTPIGRDAVAIVSVNGRDYAGFGSVEDAEEAVRMWRMHWAPGNVPRRYEVRARGGRGMVN